MEITNNCHFCEARFSLGKCIERCCCLPLVNVCGKPRRNMVFKVESVIKFAFIILWPRKKRDSMQNHEGIFYGKRRHAKHEKWCVLPRPPLCKKCDVTLSLSLLIQTLAFCHQAFHWFSSWLLSLPLNWILLAAATKQVGNILINGTEFGYQIKCV